MPSKRPRVRVIDPTSGRELTVAADATPLHTLRYLAKPPAITEEAFLLGARMHALFQSAHREQLQSRSRADWSRKRSRATLGGEEIDGAFEDLEAARAKCSPEEWAELRRVVLEQQRPTSDKALKLAIAALERLAEPAKRRRRRALQRVAPAAPAAARGRRSP